MKYVKRPVVIEAWQFSKWNYKQGVPLFLRNTDVRLWSRGEKIEGEITTLEGKMHVSENDYIIKGVNGEFYPCKPDIFEKSYELVEE